MSDRSIPDGWEVKIAFDCFSQISAVNKKVKTKECNSVGDYPVIDQGQGLIAGYIDDKTKLIQVDDPLIVFGDHTRAVKWVDFDFVPGADGTKILSPYRFFLERFAYHQLVSLEIPDKGYSRHFKFFKELDLVIPSLAEQKVIADKLDSLLAQVETTKVRLDGIPDILKHFRQSVLAAAVSGRLTEEWRDQNKVSLEWEHKSFLELISKLRSGSGAKPTDNTSGIPILRSSAVRPRVIDYSDVKYLQSEDGLKDNNYLKNGDLLFTRLSGSAEYVGNCALVKGITKNYQYPDRLFCARLKEQSHASYLELFFSENSFKKHIFQSIKSSAGHQRITLDALKTATISLPSKPEQTEIVRRVEELFAFADAVEQKAQAASERVNKLTQSILAKAFRGELTADWRAANPDLISGENSAEALLEKIKAEREALKPKKKTRAKK